MNRDDMKNALDKICRDHVKFDIMSDAIDEALDGLMKIRQSQGGYGPVDDIAKETLSNIRKKLEEVEEYC